MHGHEPWLKRVGFIQYAFVLFSQNPAEARERHALPIGARTSCFYLLPFFKKGAFIFGEKSPVHPTPFFDENHVLHRFKLILCVPLMHWEAA